MSRRPALRALAERAGILPGYRRMGGRLCRTTDATREALLHAMGLEASTEVRAREALRELDAAASARILDRARVVFRDEPSARRLPLRWPDGRAPFEWRLEVAFEHGPSRVLEGRGRPRHVLLPRPPAVGYHALRLVASRGGEEHVAEQQWIVAPRRGFTAGEALGRRRGFGLLSNLYSLRGRDGADDPGVGDLADLRRVVRFAGEVGADFVGTSPLAALWNREPHVVPYAPVTRLYRNELYLDLRGIPELAAAERAGRLRGLPEPLPASRDADPGRIDYAGAAARKRAVLRVLHDEFTRRQRAGRSQRGRDYARFLAREGEALTQFATFMALAEQQRDRGGSFDWRRWPARWRRPDSPEVRRFREERPDELDFHCWVQFELDRQLARLSTDARAAGLSLGIYQDLPVGSHPGGFDPWLYGRLFARGASVGAPPDDFSEVGQDWGLPPVVPTLLRDEGFAWWIRLLRHAFAHAGALRIDHAMGLERLFWVPQGGTAREGAYVRQPARELYAILALESARQGALVVAEDLGTVPAGLPARLARHGFLSSRVLYFEQQRGRFRPASRYPKRALVSANTHDLAPLAGFLDAADLALRRSAGQLRSRASFAASQAERRTVVTGLLRRLRRDGLLDAGDPEPASIAGAVAGFLGRTPCRLLAISLDDLAGEREPVNLPGVPQSRYASWTRRMRVPVESLGAQPACRAALAALAVSGRRRTDSG